jgi:hypothetical protein
MLSECLCLFLVQCGIVLAEVSRKAGLLAYAKDWYDNAAYLDVAAMVQHSKAANYSERFLGLPMAIVGVSHFHISNVVSLVLISILASCTTCIIVYRLYGGSVALWFSILNPQWITVSVLGSTEPLFTSLWMASFLCARKNLWTYAALFASLAATVRPVGIFALIAFVVILRNKVSLKIAGVAIIVGSVYVWIAWRLAGDPFFNYRLYAASNWRSNFPVTFPLSAIIPGSIEFVQEMPWTHWLQQLMWFMISALLLISMIRKCLNRTECVATILYFLFFLCYNDENAVRGWDRYMIPIFPTLLSSAELPFNRYLLWIAGALAALLASASVVTFKAVFGFAIRK